jgi:hypothetical protein
MMSVLAATVSLPAVAEAAVQAVAPLEPPATIRVRALDPSVPPTDASGSVHPAIEAVRKLLARFEQAPLPRIYVVDPVPLKAKTQANTAAFRVWRGSTPDPNVFVNARADLWQRASRGERVATIALSAAIAHEIVHGRTKDEGPATQREIEILQYFLGHDASLTNEERAILHRAIEAANRYGRHTVPDNALAEQRDGGSKRPNPDLAQPADPVISAAVALIQRRLPSVPRIDVVDPATLKVTTSSSKTPAFRLWYGDQVNPTVFVNKFGDLYSLAARGDSCALKSLAALLAHEIAHTRTKSELEPSRIEAQVLDEFLKDPMVAWPERTCLIERRKTVLQYGVAKRGR